LRIERINVAHCTKKGGRRKSGMNIKCFAVVVCRTIDLESCSQQRELEAGKGEVNMCEGR